MCCYHFLASSGGTLKVPGGLELSFGGASSDAASALSTAPLADNLDTAAGPAVAHSSFPGVVRALRRAQDDDVFVVDLPSGQTCGNRGC